MGNKNTYIEVRERPYNMGLTVHRSDAGFLNKKGIDAKCAELARVFPDETHSISVVETSQELSLIDHAAQAPSPASDGTFRELIAQLPLDITIENYENVYFWLTNDGDGLFVCEAMSDRGPRHETVFVDTGAPLGEQPLAFMMDSPEEAVQSMLNWLRNGKYLK